MKKLLVGLLTLISLSGLASHNLQSEDPGLIRTAILEALQGKNFNCHQSLNLVGEDVQKISLKTIEDFLRMSDVIIEIHASGIKATLELESGETWTIFQLSEDKKQVSAVYTTSSRIKFQNVGTIVEPDFRDALDPVYQEYCTVK